MQRRVLTERCLKLRLLLRLLLLLLRDRRVRCGIQGVAVPGRPVPLPLQLLPQLLLRAVPVLPLQLRPGGAAAAAAGERAGHTAAAVAAEQVAAQLLGGPHGTRCGAAAVRGTCGGRRRVGIEARCGRGQPPRDAGRCRSERGRDW